MQACVCTTLPPYLTSTPTPVYAAWPRRSILEKSQAQTFQTSLWTASWVMKDTQSFPLGSRSVQMLGPSVDHELFLCELTSVA